MRNLFKIFFLITCILCFVFVQNIQAQYQVNRSVIGSGAGYIANALYSIKSTLGQPVIGVISDNSYSNYVGFWYYGDLYVPIVDETFHQLPQKFGLFQNYPNPFNAVTSIQYQVSCFGEVELSIYNILGQKGSTLVSEKQPAGKYEVEWDASAFASGVYYYQLQAGDYREFKKMILLK